MTRTSALKRLVHGGQGEKGPTKLYATGSDGQFAHWNLDPLMYALHPEHRQLCPVRIIGGAGGVGGTGTAAAPFEDDPRLNEMPLSDKLRFHGLEPDLACVADGADGRGGAGGEGPTTVRPTPAGLTARARGEAGWIGGAVAARKKADDVGGRGFAGVPRGGDRPR